TGGQNNYKEEVYDNLERIKRVSPMPVCAGFGVSNKTQAEQLGAYTDGVIVGSKIVKIFYQGREREIKDLIPDKILTRVKWRFISTYHTIIELMLLIFYTRELV